MNRSFRPDPILLAIVTFAFVFRVIGLKFGLPCTVIADEPHHINVAVSFGTGHFNPHIFKYPTLWMYVLFTAYGLFFVFWSGFGALHSVGDFANLFVWDPTWFYLIARFLSAVSGTLVVYFLAKASERAFESPRAGRITALLLAVSPPLVYYAHQAKPDTFMMALVSIGIYFFVRYTRSGTKTDFFVGSGFFGLAASSQYTAVLATPYLFLAGLLPTEASSMKSFSERFRMTVLGGFVFMGSFILGSPYIVLDWRTFVSDLSSLHAYGSGALTTNVQKAGWLTFQQMAFCFGPGIIGPLALLAILLTIVMISIKSQKNLLLLMVPFLLGWFFLQNQNKQAAVINYAFPILPFLYVGVGSLGLISSRMPAFSRRIIFMLVGAGVLSSLFGSVVVAFSYNMVDARLKAMRWVNKNIPAGSKILLDQTYTEPLLFPTVEQAKHLLDKTTALGNSRARYFEILLRSHPGGGYALYRIERSWKELISPLERQTTLAKEAQDSLDVEAGLSTARQAGIQYVIWSSVGANRENMKRMNHFFDDLDEVEKQTPDRVVKFESNFLPGKLAKWTKEFDLVGIFSPTLKLYSMDALTKNANQ